MIRNCQTDIGIKYQQTKPLAYPGKFWGPTNHSTKVLNNVSYVSIIYYLFIYLFILQTQIYTIKKNTSYKFKQKYVCRWPVENQNMFCRQAPLNIDIISVINF